MSTANAPSPVSVTRIPNPAEPVPTVAVPTLALLVVGLIGWIASTALYVADVLPWWATIVLTAVTGYLLFTVAHDASHRSASNVTWANNLMGRLATPIFALHAAFPVFRFIHMQHHRFTNHDDGDDPDHYTMEGPAWQRPFRWLTIDYRYVAFYLPRIGSRPRKEQVEGLGFFALGILVPILLIATGNVVAWLVILFVPSRLAVLWLAYAFDYLPHHGLHHKPTEDRLKTTRNRIGGERWVSPLMLYQNYHLVHHLHPTVPFYKYLAVWHRNERAYVDGGPALSTLSGRDITPEEYRRMRELVEDHH
jgi:ring-1,2-phenylacetyl-CoA epoxidase subunit PaaE